jgi:HTH-type transcriptional regulator/antitoxin MqsA
MSAPDTMISPDTGAILQRDVRPFTVSYKELTEVVNLPGYYAEDDADAVHVGADMAEADAALRRLKERADGVPTPETVRRIRRALGLSQREAGELFGGGPRAFDKYERGLVEPSVAMGRLLFLAEKRPDLLEELRRIDAGAPAAP